MLKWRISAWRNTNQRVLAKGPSACTASERLREATRTHGQGRQMTCQLMATQQQQAIIQAQRARWTQTEAALTTARLLMRDNEVASLGQNVQEPQVQEIEGNCSAADNDSMHRQ
jgi:uncharacterized protein YdgA (DUF945 family)